MSFSERGYAGTTLQGVARIAGVHSRLVSYYFGTKQQLLLAALEPPPGYVEGIRRTAYLPLSERGEGIVRQLLAAWVHPEMSTLLRSTLLIAAHEPIAMDVLRKVFVRGILPAVSDALVDDERVIRSGLVATQLVGLALTRYVYAIDQVVAIPDDRIIASIGATVQAYLDGELAGSLDA